jgi:heavy metal sensor kinase
MRRGRGGWAPRTIRARLVAINVAALAASLLLFATFAYLVFSYSVWRRLDEGLRATVDTVAVAFRTGLTGETDEQHAAHHLLNELRFPNRRFGLFDARGRPYPYTSAESQGPHHEHGPAVAIEPVRLAEIAADGRLFDDPDSHAYDTRELRDGSARLVVRGFVSPSSGARFLIAAEEPTAGVESLLGILRAALLSAIPVFVLLAGVGGWFLASRSLAPVAAMSHRARQISAETLDARLPVANARDELGELASAFNALLDRLELAFAELRRVTEQMRRFNADASHELRTPLAAMRGEAQVALTRPRSEGEYRESLEVLFEEASHMALIVENMFTLARADAGEAPAGREPFYLDEVAAEAARIARPLAETRGVALAADAAQELEVLGDEGLIRRAILNLVDNAIKYTEPGGSVRVAARRDGDWARVDVVDTGPGVSAEDRDRIFERFFRVEKARSRQAGGAGLGLSIVRWAAESHGGRAEVASEPGRGSTFSIVLPLGGEGA